MVASGSDDGTIGIWKVPDNFTIRFEDPEEINDVKPVSRLKGHSKKVGHVLFHPVASNILASSSADCTVKIWNIDSGEAVHTLPHEDLITGMAFNEDGSLLATTSRDKRIRVWEIRQEKIISEGKGHNGAKSQRLVWLGGHDRIVTTGFDRSDRQYALWDAHNIEKGPIGGFHFMGESSGICMPFYDEGSNIVYLAGKGDGNIQYYEYENDDLFPLSEYQSAEPQRGIAIVPRRALTVQKHEIFRIYKTLNDTSIEPISFIVPRRADTFQADVYPDAKAGVAALSAEEWFSGKNSLPKQISLAAVFDGQDVAAFDGKPSLNAKTSKEVVKPAEPKVEKKKEGPPGPAEPKQEQVKNLDEVLQSDQVTLLLERASNIEDPDAKASTVDDSSWDLEDDKPAAKVSTNGVNGGGSSKPVEEKIKVESVAKDEEPSKNGEPATKAEPVTKTEPAPKAERVTKAEPITKVEPLTKGEPATKVEPISSNNLYDQVSNLTAMVETLVSGLKSRDEKIQRLEEKIDALLSRN